MNHSVSPSYKKAKKSTPSSTLNIRGLAARTLAPVLQKKASLNALFDQNIKKLDEKDRGLFQELCFGTLRYFFELEAISKQLLSKPLKNKDADIFACVLLGLYQIRQMRTPDHAAISESVHSAKSTRKPWAGKFVNGVLRTYLRDKDTIETKVAKNQELSFNHPSWLVNRIKRAWPNQWQDILRANNHPAPMCLRNNAQQGTRDDYVKQLNQENIDVEICDSSPNALRLTKAQDPKSLPLFYEGRVSVQDEAAQLAAYFLDLEAQHRVLDACCAPGGKSCHILETQTKISELVSADIDSERLKRVEENLNRLKLNAKIVCADLSDLDSWWDGETFDRILLDAPCSATGVIRRHPDIKLLRRENDLAKLVTIQKHLLETLWQTLKPDGVLVYATCSVLPEENEDVISDFVAKRQQTKDVTVLTTNMSDLNPSNHKNQRSNKGEDLIGQAQSFGRQFFPQINGHDGFYYARLRKLGTKN